MCLVELGKSSIIVFVVKPSKVSCEREKEVTRSAKSLFFRNNVPSCRSHSRQIKSIARKASQEKSKSKQQVNFIRHNKETHA
jgi:hypothetical protein